MPESNQTTGVCHIGDCLKQEPPLIGRTRHYLRDNCNWYGTTDKEGLSARLQLSPDIGKPDNMLARLMPCKLGSCIKLAVEEIFQWLFRCGWGSSSCQLIAVTALAVQSTYEWLPSNLPVSAPTSSIERFTGASLCIVFTQA